MDEFKSINIMLLRLIEEMNRGRSPEIILPVVVESPDGTESLVPTNSASPDHVKATHEVLTAYLNKLLEAQHDLQVG